MQTPQFDIMCLLDVPGEVTLMCADGSVSLRTTADTPEEEAEKLAMVKEGGVVVDFGTGVMSLYLKVKEPYFNPGGLQGWVDDMRACDVRIGRKQGEDIVWEW